MNVLVRRVVPPSIQVTVLGTWFSKENRSLVVFSFTQARMKRTPSHNSDLKLFGRYLAFNYHTARSNGETRCFVAHKFSDFNTKQKRTLRDSTSK